MKRIDEILVAVIIAAIVSIGGMFFTYQGRISKLEAQIESKQSISQKTSLDGVQSILPVSSVTIDNFNPDKKTVNGNAVLSRDGQYWILIFAGKSGGPYWLQGATGKLLSKYEPKKNGDNWVAKWSVSEVYIGKDVVDLHAVAISPQDIHQFKEAGIADQQAGNAIKVLSVDTLPEPKVVSPKFIL